MTGRLLRGCFWGGMLLLLATASLAHVMLGAAGDKEFLLATAEMWRGGKKLYHDLFQPNLPMIIWLYAGVQSLAGLFAMDDGRLLAVAALMASVLSAVLCQRVLASHSLLGADKGVRWWLGVVLLYALIVVPDPRFFADREHWIMLLLLPYLLHSMPSLQATSLTVPIRLMIGVMAGLAVCIKPHALVLVAGAALARRLYERGQRGAGIVEVAAMGCVLGAYLLLMRFYCWDYFAEVVPVLKATYAGNQEGITQITRYATAIFTLGVTLADFRLRHQSPLRGDILYLLLLLPFFLGYILINNGWLYTFYPLNALLMLLTFWVWREFAWLQGHAIKQGESPRPFYFGKMACTINLVVNSLTSALLCAGFIYMQLAGGEPTPRDRMYNEMAQLIKDNPRHSFGTLSGTAVFWPRVVRTQHVPMDTRFNLLVMFKAFLLSDASFIQKNGWILEWTANAYAEDLNHNKPALMFVDAGEDFHGSGQKVNLVKFFSRYPAFEQAWSHYTLMAVIDHCEDEDVKKDNLRQIWCRNEVYVRNGEH